MLFLGRALGVLGVLLFALTASAQTAEPSAAGAPEIRNSPAAPRISFNYVHVDGSYIALTFDDGPQQKLTPKLLDLLAQHHIKATFFVVGQNAAEYPDIVARAAREGHEIGNHTWSHPNLAKMSDENIRRQLRQTDDAIKQATGKHPTLMRPPYGNLSTRQKQWIHQEFGYRIVLWDVDPLDWKRPGPNVICNRIVKETRPGSIVSKRVQVRNRVGTHRHGQAGNTCALDRSLSDCSRARRPAPSHRCSSDNAYSLG